MIRRVSVLLAIASALEAQEWHYRGRTERAPQSCAQADSLLGPTMEWERIVESRDRLSDSAIVSSRTWKRSGWAIGTRFEGDARAFREGRGAYGLTGLLFTVSSDGAPVTNVAVAWIGGGPVIAGVGVDPSLSAQSSRVDGAATARIVADTMRISAPVFLAGSKPGGIGLFRWDALIVPLTPTQIVAIADAKEVRWRIAALEGELPSEGRMAMKAVARETLCAYTSTAAERGPR